MVETLKEAAAGGSNPATETGSAPSGDELRAELLAQVERGRSLRNRTRHLAEALRAFAMGDG